MTTNPIRVSLSVDCDDILSYAASQSGRRLVRQVKVTSRGPDEFAGTPLHLDITVNAPTPAPPAVADPIQFPLPREGETVTFHQLDVQADPRVLGLLDEKVAGQTVISVSDGEDLLVETRSPLTVLAYNQWMHRSDYYESLAAFVLPGHDSLDPIATRAAALLMESTGDDSLQGYQGGAERARQIASALYEAIRERGFGYIDPPASFEGYGQKIRTPDTIEAESRATCLETTVLYAAALARAGLDPVLFVVRNHAFAGYATSDPRSAGWSPELRDLYLEGDAVVSSRNDLIDLVSNGLVQPVETTTLTSGLSQPFDQACQVDLRYFNQDSKDLDGMVIVHRAWALGVVPVAARIVANGEVRLITQSVPDVALAVRSGPMPSESDADEEPNRQALAAFHGPGRVRQWLASLLDLTRRNRLLNLTVKSSGRGTRTLEFSIPMGLLPDVEDRIFSSAQGIELASPTRLSRPVRDAGLSNDSLIDDFHRTNRLYWPSPSALQPEIDQVKRLITEDAEKEGTRVAPGHVETQAEHLVAERFQRDLERLLNNLKRNAKEIEDLTGSNSLFLTIGMLSWDDDDGKPWSAPLFLIPARIEGSRGAKHRIVIDEGAEITPNYCLREKLKQTYDLDIAELETPELDDAGIDVRKLIDTVRSRLRASGIRNAAVQERTVLAILNYSSFRLWKDLRDHWESFSQTSPVVKHLIEQPQQQFEDPAIDEPLLADPLCPVEVDDSQRDAVRWAVSGRSFVLQGPPGTGKSQTITNILAGAMAEGKSVLFVAEKQPALEVVKSRLEAVGLSSFCLDLHSGGDSQAKVRAKLKRQLTEAIEADHTVDSRQWDDVNAKYRVKGAALDQYRDAIHDRNAAGFSVWNARQALRRLGAGPTASVPRDLVQSKTQDWESIRDALLASAELNRTVAPIETHSWTLVEGVEYESLDRAALALAIAEWSTAATEITSLTEPWTCLTSIDDPQRFSEFLDFYTLADLGMLPDTSAFTQVQHPQWRAVATQALDESKRALVNLERVLDVLSAEIFETDIAALASDARAAQKSNALFRKRRLKAYAAGLGSVVVDDTDPVAVAAAVVTASEHIDDLQIALSHIANIPGVVLPDGWLPTTPGALDSLTDYLNDLERLAPVSATPSMAIAVDAMARGDAPDQLVRASVQRASDAWAGLSEYVQWTPESVKRWRDGQSLVTAWQGRSSELVTDAADNRFLDLQRWARLISTLEPLRDAGLDVFVDDMLAGRIPLSDAPDAAQRGLLDVALQERLEVGAIDRFDGLEQDDTVKSYGSLDSTRRHMMRSLIPAQLVDARSFRPGERIGEYGELERELTKKRRRLPIRGLVSKYGDRLVELTPCFLMSPDSVATYLPPSSVTFDLVVFDEASQITVAEAIGVLGRGRAAVIVGDTKQMPPTVFGGAKAPTIDDDWESEAEEFYVAEDMESILDECNESNLAELTLSRHYRSRHESLIAFSNRAFYESSLITFPSPHREGAAIGFRRIPGQYLRKTSPNLPGREFLNTNPVEAEAIVTEVLDRLSNPHTRDESICIVTFNAQQMRLVRDMLEERGGPDIGLLLDERRQSADMNTIEPQLKIRNLETVQGDEADVVLFSIAFSARESDASDTSAASRRVPLNFGPLNRSGGERRLNVAVSRARKEMVVFCSFDPEDLAVRETSAQGIRLLRQFLEIARDGVEHTGDLTSHTATSIDYHLADISEALRAEGVRVGERIGLSQFKIDLALGREGEEGWRVAVLLDGPTWAETESTYEREILPITILDKVRQWQAVARIWLPSWLDERERVITELVEVVNTDPPVPEPTPTEADADARVEASAHERDPVEVTPAAQQPAETHANAIKKPSSVAATAQATTTNHDLPFVPFPDLPRGSREVLDRLDIDRNRRAVITVFNEVVNAEGPIEIERLCKTVARCFDLRRVRAERLKSLMRLVPRQSIRRGPLGTFVWPAGIESESWDEYRHTIDAADRSLNEVAPEEITNAMADFCRRGGSISVEELIERVKVVFGIGRLSAANKERLEDALLWAIREDRVELENDRARLPT